MFGRFALLSRVLAVTAVTVAAGACWSGAAGAATLTPPATSGPAGRHLSAAAPATVALTPVSVTAGSTGNSFTFTISAVAALSGHTRITIPATWPAPQASNPAGPGYVTAARATCKSAAKPVVTGAGPWTISVAMNCAAGKHFTVTYGAGTGSTRVQAPTTAGSYTFATAVKLGTTTDPLSVPPLVVQPGPAADFVVSGLPRPSETGAPLPVTVTADDAFGNVATSYRGTVAFTSSDPGASLPGDYTFTAADSGTHTFAGGVTFLHEGTQSVTATDTASSSVTGSDSVPVNGVLFVSLNGSNSYPGTQAQPMGTVSAAVSKAAASSPPFAVDVAAGTYNEGGGVTVTSGITIEGGFDPSTWSHSSPETTTITGSPWAVDANAATGVLLDDLTLRGTASSGSEPSAYGLLAVNNSSVTLTYVTASAGNGTTGQAVAWGTPGASGQNGTYGGDAQSSGGCTSSFGSGGSGGAYVTPGGTGGTGGCSGGSGDAGASGQGAGGASGGAGGPGGAGDDQSQATGGNGSTGTNGANGASGTGAINTLAGAGITWAGATGGNGTFGQDAGAGGGGGGGGALTQCVFLFCTYNGGAGGGGGGGGGAGGGGGTGGAFGGGSFGIYLWNSIATVQDYSTITAGNGGTGGTGGSGGTGGQGGEGNPGGQGINGSGDGGTGGWGGSGGTGGGGGGGAGGPSIGIFRGGSSTATTDSTDIITFGTGGAGGPGGTGAGTVAPSGQQGQSGAIVP
jgi:hypothetical protein